MNIDIMLKGEVVAKKNHRIVTKKANKTINIPSKEYKAWHEKAEIQIARQKIGVVKAKTPLDVPCCILVFLCHKDKRRRDGDNQVSSVLDLLVDTGVLKDDKWQIARIIIDINQIAEEAGCCIHIATEGERVYETMQQLLSEFGKKYCQIIL